ncbi:MAG TPA: nuclear transport factor 2 family protein [Solirubrobacterales bacterium]|nr:nuclear transport factor 2 family protein [Solirubrobacterales bacterium]
MTIDAEQIRALTHEYTFRLDGGDFAGVAALLAAGALRMSAKGMDEQEMRGAEEIERFYANQVVTHDGDPRTRHVISNHVVDIDGEGAHGRCYFTVLMKPPRQPIQIVVCGRYFDTFERHEGAWRFLRKVIQVDYLTDISEHFLIDADHAA